MEEGKSLSLASCILVITNEVVWLQTWNIVWKHITDGPTNSVC